jgi:hypothetical protein
MNICKSRTSAFEAAAELILTHSSESTTFYFYVVYVKLLIFLRNKVLNPRSGSL